MSTGRIKYNSLIGYEKICRFHLKIHASVFYSRIEKSILVLKDFTTYNIFSGGIFVYRKQLLLFISICMTVLPCSAFDGKTLSHLISIPVVEGTGIYSSVKNIRSGGGNGTAAAVTNLSLMGINAGLGAYTLFGEPDNYQTLRTLHRIFGFALTAAGVWLTVSTATNDDMTALDKGIAGGYTGLTVVPVILFSF